MSEHIERTIADLQNEIQRDEEKVSETKRVVNRLCKMVGREPIYADADAPTAATISSFRRDKWYGVGISTAIREYLSMRRTASLGPATVNEIFEALTAGGFQFDTKDTDNAKRGLRISLTKNTTIFHRLPDGKHYGLLEWYPEMKNRKPREPDPSPEPESEPEPEIDEDSSIQVVEIELPEPDEETKAAHKVGPRAIHRRRLDP